MASSELPERQSLRQPSSPQCPPPRRQQCLEQYSARFQEAGERSTRQRKRERVTGYLQLLIVTFTVIWALWFLRHWSRSALLLLVPVALFVVTAVLQERFIRSVRRWTRVRSFYERGLQRLTHQWAGTGETGERFLDPAHPYARDLDLFGKGSLFELLATARTRAGEETLARWLLSPAPIAEIRRRQEAVLELRDRLDFREKLFILGEDFRAGVEPAQLVAWGEEAAIFSSPLFRVLSALLAALWLASVAVWAVWGSFTFLVLITLLNLALSHHEYARVSRAAGSIEGAAHNLKLLSGVLTAFERERFATPKLVELQSALKNEGTAPSAAITRLNRLAGYLDSAHNPVMKLLDPVIFWRLQFVLAIEEWRQRVGPALRGWIDSVGELEALESIASYAYENPEDTFPELAERGPESAPKHPRDLSPQFSPLFHAKGFAHPLIPAEKAVRNDLDLGKDLAVVILSGPNMAGKSTFLRGIGVNVVLAQSGAPVRARRCILSPLAVTASICVLDSLEGGVSRFYSEIRRLKQILDMTHGPLPVLFLMDELLSGTNSHDRLIGTRSIVAKLAEQGAIGLVTTHDLALTGIPELIGARSANYHFADHLENGGLCFDYKLRPGVVQTSNALQLMRSIGLEI